MGKLVLPNLVGIGFVPVQIEEAKPPAVFPIPATHSKTLDVIKGDVTDQLNAGTTPERIAQIVGVL